MCTHGPSHPQQVQSHGPQSSGATTSASSVSNSQTRLITKAIRTISSGCGMDDYTEIQIYKDGAWQPSARFYQSDDQMMTKLQRHLEHLKQHAS